jgi:hypothetical protein
MNLWHGLGLFVYTMHAMQRLILPLCVIGILLGAGTAHGFFAVWGQVRQQWSQAAPASSTAQTSEEAPAIGPLFLDVEGSSWYKPYVTAAAERTIVSGYRDGSGADTGHFGPADRVNIAEALKMTIRASGMDERLCAEPTAKGDDPYYIEAEHHWAGAYIGCGLMRDFRLLREKPDVNRPMRRGEMIGLIHDAFGIKAPALPSLYADTEGHPYEADIAYATVQKVVSGDGSGMMNAFRPDDSLNRAEAAKMIMEALKAYGGQVSSKGN